MTIKFRIGEFSKVILSVFNPVGEKVTELVNDHLKSGNYDVKFDASHLSSGVYLYMLKTGAGIISKKNAGIKIIL